MSISQFPADIVLQPCLLVEYDPPATGSVDLKFEYCGEGEAVDEDPASFITRFNYNYTAGNVCYIPVPPFGMSISDPGRLNLYMKQEGEEEFTLVRSIKVEVAEPREDKN